MSQARLPPAKRDEILRLGRTGRLSFRDIAEQVGVSGGTVGNVMRGVERDPLEIEKPAKADRIEEYAAYHKEKFAELLERFNKWIGDTGKHHAPKGKPAKRVRIAACNDLHAPFHREDILARFINDNRGADECWIVGDLLDLFTFSRYPKKKRPFSPVEEFQSGRAVIKTIAEHFPKVRVMAGNHDERFVKYLVRCGIPPDIIEFFDFAYPDFTSPLAKLCAGYENVEMMEAKKIDYAEYPFIHQIGDVVLSHAEKFSIIPNKAVTDVVKWLKAKAEPMGIVKPFRVVGQAHTHHAGKTWGEFGVVGIEMGCMAKVPDYDGDPKVRGGGPTVLGYTVFVQENGVTDINASNFIQLA